MYRLACVILVLISVLGSSGQESEDPLVILSRVKDRVLADVARLPRYVCEQNITRQYYAATFQSEAAGSCKEVLAERGKRTHELKPYAWDRMRLDIAVSGPQEIYSWAGAPRLGQATLEELSGRGPLGSGDFGPFINAVFNVAKIKFEKEQTINRRRLLEYSYDVPQQVSRYEILSKPQGFITAYSGTLLLDPKELDLIDLSVTTAELPPGTHKCQAISDVEYGRVLIHDRQTLMPRETRLRVIGRGGEEAFVTTLYSNCHEYSSKSVLRFEPVEETQSGGTKPGSAAAENPIPPGLHFDLRVATPIDSETASAGDPLDAVLRSPIRDKSGVVLAATGTHLHARLVRVEHRSQPGDYVEIAIEIESIEINGKSVPLRVALDTQSTTTLRFLGRPRAGETVARNGHFVFFGDHLKAPHLDSQAVTMAPEKKQ